MKLRQFPALIGLCVAVSVAGLLPSPVHASVFLVGAQFFSSTSGGANSGIVGGAYQYSTNGATVHAPIVINGVAYAGGGSGISVLLGDGLNNFTFDVQSSSDPGQWAGLNLFFNTSGTAFNPGHTGVGIPGGLSVFTVTDGGASFMVPSGGTNVQSFETSSTLVSSTSYSGLSSLELDDRFISVSSFSADSRPQGGFSISVAPIPEPTGAVLCLMVGLILSGRRTRAGSRSR